MIKSLYQKNINILLAHYTLVCELCKLSTKTMSYVNYLQKI